MMKRNLLVIGLATLLGACGFQLRGVGSGEFALKELALDARNSYGETTRLTEAQLQGYGVRLHAGALQAGAGSRRRETAYRQLHRFGA